MSDPAINFGRTQWVSYLHDGQPCIGQIAGGGKVRADGSRSNVLIFTDDDKEISVLATDVFKNVPEPAWREEDADEIPQADASDQEEEEEQEDEDESEEEEEALAAAQAEAESEEVGAEEAESDEAESDEEEAALAAAQAEAEAEAETEAEETDVEDKGQADQEEDKGEEDKGEEEEEEEEEETPAVEEVAGQEVQGESEGAIQVDAESAPAPAPAPEVTENEQIRRSMDWFAEALSRIDGAATVSAEAKGAAKKVVRVFAVVCVDRASQNEDVLKMAKSSWLALKQRVDCAPTWELINAQVGSPPFETPSPPPTPPSSPVRGTRKGAMQKASERRETPLNSKKRQKVQQKLPVEANPQEPEEVELADVDKDEYVVVTTDDTAADILTACKLDNYDNYYEKRKLRNETKGDDPLLTAFEGTSTLQKIRALVRQQVKKFSEAHVCKAARVLYLVLVCENSAYTDLRSALAYFKKTNPKEALTNLCLLVLNKRTNQPPLIPIVEKMYRMLKAVADVLVSP